MKPDSHSNSAESSDPLTEALLSEHARLGTANDEGLLATVRARTIEVPGPMEPVSVTKAHFGWADWAKVAAMVTIALGGLWLVLQMGTDKPVVSGERPEHTLRLVVIPQAKPGVPSVAREDRGQVKVPDSRGAEQEAGMSFENFELADLSLSTELLSEFSVSAKKISETRDEKFLVYEGDVLLKHPDFTLKADRLELAADLRDGERLVGGFVASGDEIEIDRYSAAGGMEVATAREVTYSPEGGALILRGGASLSSGNSFVRPENPEGAIVLLQDGYQVIEAALQR